MHPEGFHENKTKDRLNFEYENPEPGKELYFFDGVVVVVDTTGKNIQGMPELLFGTFSDRSEHTMLYKPSELREGIDMSYISECIQKVSSETGVHEFWFDAFGDDVADNKKEMRREARIRLFSRYVDIKPGPEEYGYIISI